MACEATAYARAGLIGNPSDGYFGKTLSFVIRDYAAKVSLYESHELDIVPSIQDRSKYSSIREMSEDVVTNGYYGGIRLMKASIRKFLLYCDARDIPLHDENFNIRYRSTIPRRLGMAGSSALITATMRCLLDFYDLHIENPELANLILSVETEELGIGAGLQDRVIQVYEGAVFMDFERSLMEGRGYGEYEEIDPGLLPNLFVAYLTDLGEGSEVFHNNVRQRWNDGDPEIIQAMQDFAQYAQDARDLIVAGKGQEIGPLLTANFERRASIFKLDPRNVDMVERAQSVGAHAKFSGSGGAIVGVYQDEAQYEKLEAVMQDGGIAIFKPTIEG